MGLRELARAIGWDASRYQYYEDSYKKPHLPADLIDLIRPHILGRGEPPVTEAELESLLPPPRVAPPQTENRSPTPVQDSGRDGFGDYVRATRELRGIGARDFAKLVGLRLELLSKLETQNWAPDDEVVRRIARILALDGDDLVARARRARELEDLMADPAKRVVVEALLRTTRDLSPNKLVQTLEQLRNRVGKPKP